MPRVQFTANLLRHIECPTCETSAATVGEALEEVFAGNARLRGYVLDDLGRVRQHVIILVDDRIIVDRDRLSDPLSADSQVYVFQALSGG